MKVEKKEKYTLLTPELDSFEKFFEGFSKKFQSFLEDHIILQLSCFKAIINDDFLLFLDKSNIKKANGTSFVIVSTNANIDELPEELNIVPTLIEAEDIIEMESIERELGL